MTPDEHPAHPPDDRLRMASTGMNDEMQPESEAEGQSLDLVQRLLV